MNESMGSVVAGTSEVTASSAKFFEAAAGTFVSPWTQDSNLSNHATVFPHGLGVIPQSLMVIFSPDQQTGYPLLWSWEWGATGNPVTISMDEMNITLEIFSGAPLHGVWSSAKPSWTIYGSGYWKVIARA